jgi:hypothetical protein
LENTFVYINYIGFLLFVFFDFHYREKMSISQMTIDEILRWAGFTNPVLQGCHYCFIPVISKPIVHMPIEGMKKPRNGFIRADFIVLSEGSRQKRKNTGSWPV